MKNHNIPGLAALFASAFLFMPSSVTGAVSIGVTTWSSGTGSDVVHVASTTDLVNTGSPALEFFASTSFTNPTRVNDGILVGAGEAFLYEDDGDYPAMITFYLDTTASPLGYTVSSIVTTTLADFTLALGGTQNPRQSYTVDYSVVGSAGFTALATVNVYGTEYGSTQVTLLDVSDELTGVDVLRFTWMDPSSASGEMTWLSEIDVFGAPTVQVPEPGAAAMMAGALVLLGMRRRKQ